MLVAIAIWQARYAKIAVANRFHLKFTIFYYTKLMDVNLSRVYTGIAQVQRLGVSIVK